MGKFSLYTIPLKSMTESVCKYTFDLDNKFFELIGEDSEIRKGNVKVDLVVKKTIATFELNFTIKGEVYLPCDRCLDDIEMSVDTENKLIAKFGETYSEESDEIVIVPESEGEINVAWFLYEFILLSLPMKHVHPAGQCNKTMSSKLNRYKVSTVESSDDDEEDDEDEDNNSGNSRSNHWGALNDLDFEDD